MDVESKSSNRGAISRCETKEVVEAPIANTSLEENDARPMMKPVLGKDARASIMMMRRSGLDVPGNGAKPSSAPIRITIVFQHHL